MAKPKKRSAPQRRAAKTPLEEATLTGMLTLRMKPYAGLAAGWTAIAGAIVSFYFLYTWIGGPVLVSDRTLESTTTAIKREIKDSVDATRTDVTKNIANTKNELTDNVNNSRKEIQLRVDDVSKQLDKLVRQTDRNAVQVQEVSQRGLFLQKQSILGQLNQINERLNANPKDSLANQRKQELEGFLRSVDQEINMVREQIRKGPDQ